MVRSVPHFNQRESRIKVKGLTHDLTAFTWEAWMAGPKRVNRNPKSLLAYRAGAAWYCLLLETSASKPRKARLRFVLDNGTGITTDVHSVEQDYAKWRERWRHVAVCFDGRRPTIYLDGTATTSATSDGRRWMPKNDGLVFGSYKKSAGGNRLYFKGRLTELRLWKMVRNGDQIGKNRFCPLSEEDSLKCVAYWPLDEGSGDVINDRSPAKHHGLRLDGQQWVDGRAQTGGPFMDDIGDSLTVTENGTPIPSHGSDWGTVVVAGQKRTLTIANNCPHCSLALTAVTSNSTDFSTLPLLKPVSLYPKGQEGYFVDEFVSFLPKTEGPRSATITVTTNRPFYKPHRFRFPVKADYRPQPRLEVWFPKAGLKRDGLKQDGLKQDGLKRDGLTARNNETFSLGSLPANAVRKFVVKNSGGSTLVVNSLNPDTSADFTLASLDPNQTLPAYLGTNQKLAYNLTFTPKGEGLREAAFTIAHNETTAPFRFAVSAEYNAKPIMLVSVDGEVVINGQSDSWGSVAPGTEKNLSIANFGKDRLKIRKIALSPVGVFRLTPSLTCGTTVNAAPARGNPKNLKLRFIGKGVPEAQSATMTIQSNDANQPNFTVLLSATSNAISRIVVTHKGLNVRSGTMVPWGTVDMGHEETVYIGNRGKTALNVSSIACDSPEFEIVNDCDRPITLAAESNDTLAGKSFTVRFRPDATQGDHSAETNITIKSDDPAHGELTFQLQATCANSPQLVVLDGGSTVNNRQTQNWGNTARGTSRWYMIKNAGNQDLQIERTQLDPAAGFCLSPVASPTLAPGAATPVRLTFNGGNGCMRGRIQIFSNDPDMAAYSFDVTAEEPPVPKMEVMFCDTRPVLHQQAFNLNQPQGRNGTINLRFIVYNRGQSELIYTAKLSDMQGEFHFVRPQQTPVEIRRIRVPPAARRGGCRCDIAFDLRSAKVGHAKLTIASNDPDKPEFFFYINQPGYA